MNIIAHGGLNLEPLVSDILPLSQWKDAFVKFQNKEGYKILLKP